MLDWSPIRAVLGGHRDFGLVSTRVCFIKFTILLIDDAKIIQSCPCADSASFSGIPIPLIWITNQMTLSADAISLNGSC